MNTVHDTNNILDDIISQISDKEAELIEYRMLLAEKIDKAMKAKGWKKKDLAKAVGKSRSVITRWLSGTHNFTSDTLWEIGKVLEIELINIQKKQSKATSILTSTTEKIITGK